MKSVLDVFRKKIVIPALALLAGLIMGGAMLGATAQALASSSSSPSLSCTLAATEQGSSSPTFSFTATAKALNGAIISAHALSFVSPPLFVISKNSTAAQFSATNTYPQSASPQHWTAIADFMSTTRNVNDATCQLTITVPAKAASSQPTPTQPAAACTPQDQYPETNVLYCGLPSSTSASTDLGKLETYFKDNSDGAGNADIQTVFNAALKRNSGVSGFNFTSSDYTSGWAIGTSYSDGTIKVNGQTVGTDAWIASRCAGSHAQGYCNPASRYVYFAGKNVYIRDATWFFDTNVSSKVTLVHINPATREADFALWVQCGNVLIFKPVPPAPKNLVCDSLTATPESDTLTFDFTATATATNVTINKYVFDFGDNTTQTITSSAEKVTTKHKYAQLVTDQNLTAKFTVYSSTSGVSAKTCETPVHIPGKAVNFACSLLSYTSFTQGDSDVLYNFVATTTGTSGEVPKDFTFTFAINGTNVSTQTGVLPASANSNSSVVVPFDFKYDNTKTNTLAASFSATSVTGQVTAANDAACQFSTTVSPKPTTPPLLSRTGPEGIVGLVGSSTVAGTALHQIVLRRKVRLP